jgi:hypothetical protein
MGDAAYAAKPSARMRAPALSIFKPSEAAWRLGKCDQKMPKGVSVTIR